MANSIVEPKSVPVLKPVLAAPLNWYAAMAAHDLVIINGDLPFDKRDKSTHRFAIADVRGPLNITVPISHSLSVDNCPAASDSGTRRLVPHSRPTWNDILISDHNRWWQTAATTLETAYGGTPWFHDLWPRFRHLFTDEAVGRPVLAYLLDMDATIRSILHLPTRVTLAAPLGHPSGIPVTPVPFTENAVTIPPSRQIRQDTLGHIPGLSILDPLFNLCPDDTLALLKWDGITSCLLGA